MTIQPLDRRDIDQTGFTLIEIMVAMMLVSVLAFGTTSLFVTVEDEFYALSLRQKAVFLLNGEMERLYGMYQKSAPIYPPTSPAAVYADAPLHPNVPHNIHSGTAAPHINLTAVGTPAVPIAPANFPTLEYENAVLYYTPTAIPANIQNVIWLDQEKKLTARLSWLHEDIATFDCNGGNDDKCALITLYLDFPYRYDDSVTPPNPVAPANMGKVETLILRTIMGDR